MQTKPDLSSIFNHKVSVTNVSKGRCSEWAYVGCSLLRNINGLIPVMFSRSNYSNVELKEKRNHLSFHRFSHTHWKAQWHKSYDL